MGKEALWTPSPSCGPPDGDQPWRGRREIERAIVSVSALQRGDSNSHFHDNPVAGMAIWVKDILEGIGAPILEKARLEYMET
jgi:hypothetical protein